MKLAALKVSLNQGLGLRPRDLNVMGSFIGVSFQSERTASHF